MDRIITVYAGSILNAIISIYIGAKILGDNLNLKSRKYVLSLIFLTFYLGTIYLLTDSYIRVIFTFLIFILIYKILFGKDMINCIATSFISIFIFLVSEIIYVLIVTIIFGLNSNDIKSSYFGELIPNVFISLIMFLLINIGQFVKTLSLQKIIISIKVNKILISFLVIVVSSIIVVLYFIYFNLNFVKTLILGLIIIIVLFSSFFALFKETNNSNKLKIQYETMLESLYEYEKLYSYQRMLNHEFKNNLMIIRGMTNPNNQKLLDYIDKIVNFEKSKDEKWMNTLKRIPEGGLLGILYYKLLTMDKEQINVNFEISSGFKSKDYNSIDDKTKNNVCSLLGIYLDNAIQAVKNIENKNVSVVITADIDFVYFTISNNFCGKIEVSKLCDKGYTTNENGRGYGLAIAKEIILKDSKIINKTKIVGDVFSQEIKIKM